MEAESFGGNRAAGLVDTTGGAGVIPGGPGTIGVTGSSWWTWKDGEGRTGEVAGIKLGIEEPLAAELEVGGAGSDTDWETVDAEDMVKWNEANQ